MSHLSLFSLNDLLLGLDESDGSKDVVESSVVGSSVRIDVLANVSAGRKGASKRENCQSRTMARVEG